MRAVICRKATFTVSVSAVMLSDATSPSPRAQNRGFCAFLAFGTPVFVRFEHKNEVFFLFLPAEPQFSGIPSTKSRFLCVFCLRDPHFRAFRAQNSGFCAFLAFGTTIFGRFEHKIGLFVREEVCCELCLDICLLITVLDEVCKWLLYMIGGDVRREYD